MFRNDHTYAILCLLVGLLDLQVNMWYSWVSLFARWFLQVIIWFVIPAVSNSANHTNNTLSMIVLIQYIPRVFLIISLNSKIVKASGVVTRTAWAGAAYNLLLYTLASHVCHLFPLVFDKGMQISTITSIPLSTYSVMLHSKCSIIWIVATTVWRFYLLFTGHEP